MKVRHALQLLAAVHENGAQVKRRFTPMLPIGYRVNSVNSLILCSADLDLAGCGIRLMKKWYVKYSCDKREIESRMKTRRNIIIRSIFFSFSAIQNLLLTFSIKNVHFTTRRAEQLYGWEEES